MKNIFLILILFAALSSSAQVGIGTTDPNDSSVLELQATDKGLLVPRMTESERLAINPALASTYANPQESTKGLLVYQTDGAEGFYYFDGTIWKALGGAAATDADWTIVGNDMYNANSGNVGVGIIIPSTQFHTKGSTIIGNPGGVVKNEIINEDFESGIASFVNAPSNDEDWIVDADDKNSGLFSATTINALSDGEKSTISYSITIPIGSVNPELSFYFKTDTENNYDDFRFIVNNVLNQEWNGDIDWTQKTLSLTPGVTYNFEWVYDKDGSSSTGADKVWIDDVIITEDVNVSPTPSSYVLRLEDGKQQDGYVLVSDADGNAYWDDVANATPEGLQNLSLSGFDLSITDANTVDLSPIFTDDQKNR
jgi:hypothetical protein